MAIAIEKVVLRTVIGMAVGISIAFILTLPERSSRSSLIDEIKYLPGNETAIDDSKTGCSVPLKVYMYDLPRKYNMGLLKKDDPDQELPWTDPVVPPWSLDSGVNRQHSVEYWLMVYLLNAQDCKDGGMAAVRVNDPNQADVFFVPFFSALNNYGYKMLGPDAVLAKKLQAGIVDILHKSKWWRASQGRDHVIVAHHPNALWHYRKILNQSIYIVADFGRYDNTVARLDKDIVAPYVHVLPSYNEDDVVDPYSKRDTLLFFRGRTHRKADGKVRAQLGELLMNESDVQYTDSLVSSVGLSTSMEGMRSSLFCLHPAGDTPSSCRLFDAIVNHCVPVIISDRIELPFEDDLDYNEFCLFFSSEEAIKPGHLLGTLRGMKRERWLQMWEKLKAISHHFEYQHPSKKDDAVNMIFKQVQRKVPALKLGIHRSKRLRIEDWLRRRR
ncbi:hypothetical protein M758_5G048200 [Ceratodon purpureus]|uniref:Exostosin GT47 domain-containing protein n=1 Tax=Ceratodon purpureus TaxID=3225 RepID=A0A8T0HY28_CERPU|nr:hypothetical protein KC19_5G049200 [Ceratodon purpureus]KAG0615522.1 hypothetical protein M758_5G048200 [Ceratodon purpureus]